MNRPLHVFALALRSVTLTVATAAMGILGLRCLLFHGASHEIDSLYVIAFMLAIWLVISLSSRSLLRALQINRDASQDAAQNLGNSGVDQSDSQHRYPTRLAIILTSAALAFVALSVFSFTQFQPAGNTASVVLLGFACVFAAIAIRVRLYQVDIRGKFFVVGTLKRRTYPLSEISKVEVVRVKNGRAAAVHMTNGRVVWLSGMLGDFDSMVAALSRDGLPN